MRPVQFLPAILAAALCVAVCPPAGAQTSGMVPVADAKGRFTISFPSDWEVATRDGGSVAVLGAAPREGDTFRVNVNVVVEDLPQPMGPETYAALGVQALRAVFHGFTIVDQGSATIAGRPAYYRYYTWEANAGYVVYQVQAYFTVGRMGFVLTGSTLNDPDHIRRHVPVIARIFETFRPGE